MNLPNAASSTCLQNSWQRMTGHPSITIRAVALSLTSEKVPDFFGSPDLFEPSARNTPPVSWGLEKVVSGDRKYNAVVWCDMRWKQPNFRNPEHQKGTTDATFLPNYSMGEERYLRKILSAVMPLITCIFFFAIHTQANKKTILFYMAEAFEKQFNIKALQEPQYIILK